MKSCYRLGFSTAQQHLERPSRNTCAAFRFCKMSISASNASSTICPSARIYEVRLMWIVLIILLLLCLGGLPNFGFHQYGYGPSIGLGGILIIVLIVLLVSGRL